MTRRSIALVDQAADAARILEVPVRVSRQKLGWTAEQLGERSRVSGRTVLQVENGSPSVSLDNALNVAAVVGVPLFDITDPRTLSRVRVSIGQALTLIPRMFAFESNPVSPRTSDPTQVFVWAFLPGAADPVVAGIVATSRTGSGLSFQYGDSYPARPDAIDIGPDLPRGRDVHQSHPASGMPMTIRDSILVSER